MSDNTDRNAPLDRLLHASEAGNLAEIINLVSEGVRIDLRNDKGWSALTVACYHQRSEVVTYLLTHGADPNSANFKGTTALMYAKTKAKDFQILEMLLAAGADINALDQFGRTILDYSRELNQPALCAFLTGKGALAGSDLNRA